MSTPDFRAMSTGRLREMVTSLAPHVEWSPVGLLGGLLCVFSAMLPETRVQRGSGSMPLMLHILLCGGTGEGKGQSWGIAESIARDANRTFMTGNVIHGVVGGAGLIQAVADCGEHALIIDTEYARVLRAGRRQANLSQVLRDLWDGAPVATSRAKDPVQVDAPRVAIMGHITPEEFSANLSGTDRDGGSYNRLLTLPVSQVRWLSERERMPAHLIPEAGELFARAVRFGQRVGTVTLADEAYDVADTIRQDLLSKARESEDLKPFAARCNEQVRRIAALFALFDLRPEITSDDLHAAASLVTYAMNTVEAIATGSGSKTRKCQPLILAEKVRARIELHGGSATSSQILPYVGATAAEVRALPEVVVTVERSGKTGRPATVFTLRGDDSESEPEPASHSPALMPAAAEREARRPTVVRLDAYRPEPNRAPEPAPEPKRSVRPPVSVTQRLEPLEENPFRALL
ncbi:DUF3987 domain-containing protein [Streptomyces sp. Ag109_G2-15]|uniref:DUF3987 domain-containing protein n=1 Tax=Streptomyces sp. Ag109_G2-15 TaxID=1938850 RepID=UPI000BDA3994|nr:DUF3987 domain-containing protein [Streptomyces sp. Ag109_G2-15]SOE07966.1 Protein of unknown function [Streptomyces sp. Ag109_G2-15]